MIAVEASLFLPALSIAINWISIAGPENHLYLMHTPMMPLTLQKENRRGHRLQSRDPDRILEMSLIHI